MKASWTVSRLLKEYPQCRKVLMDYELLPREIARWTLARVAGELEEDEEDFLGELDQAGQSLSEYDPNVVGDSDDDDLTDLSVDDDDDDDDDDEDDKELEEEEAPLDDESPLGDADDGVSLDDSDESEDDDDDDF